MKKKWKYILLVIVLLVLCVGGYALYVFKYKEYDVADEQVEKLSEETFVLELPDGTQVVVDGEGNVVEEKQSTSTAPVTATGNENATQQQDQQQQTNTGEENPTNPTDGTATTVIEKPTVSSIKDKYDGTFASLESQATAKLNNLIGLAKSEYVTKKANGEKINYGYFYSKYVGAAEGLEASTDAVFNILLARVEAELEVNGFNKSYAQSLRDDYEAAKQARRDSLLSQVKEAL